MRISDHFAGSSQTYAHREIPYHRKQKLDFSDFTHIPVVPQAVVEVSRIGNV